MKHIYARGYAPAEEGGLHGGKERGRLKDAEVVGLGDLGRHKVAELGPEDLLAHQEPRVALGRVEEARLAGRQHLLEAAFERAQ